MIKRQLIYICLVVFSFFFFVASVNAASVILNWGTPYAGGGVTGYSVYYGSTADKDSMTKVTGIQQTTYTIDNLEKGATYYFCVAAYNSFGEGLSSDVYNTVAVDLVSPPSNLRIAD